MTSTESIQLRRLENTHTTHGSRTEDICEEVQPMLVIEMCRLMCLLPPLLPLL